jgi:hypothetical protein
VNTVESLKPEVAAETEAESRSERLFFKIASLGTALGFGAAAASTASLRSGPVGFSFQLSVGTFVAFLVGAAIALIYWKLVASDSKAASRASVLIALAGVGLFLYPLRFVPASNLRDLTIGLVLAVIALSTVGFLIWRITRFLEKDSQQDSQRADAVPEQPASPVKSGQPLDH